MTFYDKEKSWSYGVDESLYIKPIANSYHVETYVGHNKNPGCMKTETKIKWVDYYIVYNQTIVKKGVIIFIHKDGYVPACFTRYEDPLCDEIDWNVCNILNLGDGSDSGAGEPSYYTLNKFPIEKS